MILQENTERRLTNDTAGVVTADAEAVYDRQDTACALCALALPRIKFILDLGKTFQNLYCMIHVSDSFLVINRFFKINLFYIINIFIRIVLCVNVSKSTYMAVECLIIQLGLSVLLPRHSPPPDKWEKH